MEWKIKKKENVSMSTDYRDYHDLFDSITTELEKLYHTFWDKRKEAPMFRMMGKQVKTAWMLWKLGSSTMPWEGEGQYFTNRIEERHKSHVIYVRAKYETDPSEWGRSLNERLCQDRRDKASDLMIPYLARTMMNWRDGSTFYYSDLVTAMNNELEAILYFMRYGKTYACHGQNKIDLEEAIRLLHEAQARIGQTDEKEAWAAFFSHMQKRYPGWYD